MSTIALLSDADATPDTAAIFREAKARMGKVPNLLRVMAQAPAVLDVYWDGRGALGQGVLPAKVQEQIAIAVAAANGCDYCLAAHTGAGRAAGLSAADLAGAQRGEASDGHAAAILALALDVNAAHGCAGPDILDQTRAAGLNDAEILETIAHVAISILTNSINNIVGTSLDFPRVARVGTVGA
ncbi:carboxymuconolactone decarboxylase family protein [Sphingobium yanoikuyae]|uniref:carboxymuconolactone decarboxylase family protein n=1 Tax=Sphingobium yanoikuyae TaxID=13690 RepID=UPI0007A7367A|nr:carboxymuconolactone decarboxylase family protein [Sphingobium yanoikuyae]KZC77802.1 alkylhydroperoxidase [Sphingobium yanoikuyae]